MYHLPYWPLVPSLSAMTQVRAGYNFKEASALKQVAKIIDQCYLFTVVG